VHSRPVKLQLDSQINVDANTGTILIQPDKYRRLVGKLLYLTLTRPHVSYPVQLLSHFLQTPTIEHTKQHYMW